MVGAGLNLCNTRAQAGPESAVADLEGDNAVLGWAYRNTEKFVDLLFGDFSKLVELSGQYKCDTFISVRLTGDETLDTQILIWLASEEVLRLEVKSAKGKPICDQLYEAKKKCPGCDDMRVLALLQVQELPVGSEVSRHVGFSARQLNELRMSPVPDERFRIHGTRYDVWIKSGVDVHRFYFASCQYPPDQGTSLRPLEGWCVKLLDTLQINPSIPDESRSGS